MDTLRLLTRHLVASKYLSNKMLKRKSTYAIFLLVVTAGCLGAGSSGEGELLLGYEENGSVQAEVTVSAGGEQVHNEGYNLQGDSGLTTVYTTADPDVYNVTVRVGDTTKTLQWEPADGGSTGYILIRDGADNEYEISLGSGTA